MFDVRSAKGDRYTAGQPLGNKNLLDGVQLSTPSVPGVKTELHPDGTMAVTMDHLSTETYLTFGKINAPVIGAGYTISFEARSSDQVGKGALGIGIDDGRGWNATHSGVSAEGIETAQTWKKFSQNFDTLDDCPGATLRLRFRPEKDGFTGTEEIRNLRVTAYTSEHFPAYPALTAAASRSTDGKTVYLIVFNRHHAEDISAQIDIQGIKNISCIQRWTVTGPSLAALNVKEEQVRESESGVLMPLPHKGKLTHTFPARSMTAFEIKSK